MAAQDNKTYQLSELADFIRRVFALNFPQAVWVSAEIGQVNLSRGNHWLTVVEKDSSTDAVTARLDAVVWKSQFVSLQRKHGIKLLRDLFQDGMSVRLKVTTSFHARYGLRLVVDDIDPSHTLGELERRRQLTLERLEKDGLLRKNRMVHLTTIPLKVAIISSDTAAGLADFKAQLAGNAYGYQIDARLFPAAMQGARTGPEVMARLQQILKWPETFDAVIIIRGGGGKTDLAAFDDEGLARAVANYPLPVLTGIGHETDSAILDAVAHTSLKTPTAVATFLIESLARAEATTIDLGRRIIRSASGIAYHEGPRLNRLQTSIAHSAKLSLNAEANRLSQASNQLVRLSAAAIDRERSRVEGMEKLLTALRPEATLARGFALVSQGGRLVTSAKQLKAGVVDIKFKEGRASLENQPDQGDQSN